ncbi:MAG: acyl-CoA dehydrogenase family protein [Acidimicrobiales bacterium]
MQLGYSEAELALGAELRDWLSLQLPDLPPRPDPRDWAARRRFDCDWQRRLFDAGYAGIAWPRGYGGREASPGEELVFLEEMARAGAPGVGVGFVGQGHAGPTIMAEGTHEQKAEFLPPILAGDSVWCQGFSEPGAGSDLASLSTRAVRDGDEYVISGQKIWSSFAHVADFGEVLVRTDPGAAKHRGISWLIVPMGSPGVDIRPIRTIPDTSEFCEVFFDEVRVPVANRVGPENDGWRVAMVTFGFERGTAFVGELVEAMSLAEELVAMARLLPNPETGRGRAWDDVEIQRRAGRLLAELDALWALTKWNVSEVTRKQASGPGGSVLKLRLCEAVQELSELGLDVLGRRGLSLSDVDLAGESRTGHMVFERLRHLGFTIGGGTSQIQRNIIAERILGMPKEPAWTSS